MTKRNIGNKIIEGLEEAVDFVRGKKTRAVIHRVRTTNNIDVKKIRKKLHLKKSLRSKDRRPTPRRHFA